MERYDYLLVNDDLEECVEHLHRVIQDQHFRPSCMEGAIGRMREELKDMMYKERGK